MSVIQLIQKKYLRDERVLQLLLLLSLLRGSPHILFDNDIDFFHGGNNLERDLSFGNVLGHTTHFSSSFGDVLHPKSLDRVLANYQQSVLQDLNILGNYDQPHSARHFQGTLTSHLGIQAYLLNAESSVEITVDGEYIVGSPMPESLNESDPRNSVLTASLARASNDVFEDLDLLETIWKQDLNFPFTQEVYNENDDDDEEIAELASASKLDLGHVFSFTKEKDHGEEPNGGSRVFEIPEAKDLDLLMNFTSVSKGDEFLCTNISFDEVVTESDVKEEVEGSSSDSILEADQLLEFNLDEALKLVGLDSSPESEPKDYKDFDSDSGCGDCAVSDLGTDYVPPDSLDELNDSLDEMIQASQMHHQHSRNFQGRLGGLARSGSMEQRWQDLASLLSIPSPDQAHHAQSPPSVAMASHTSSPIHTHSHSHQPTPVHHPHALYPPHEGVSLCSPSSSIPRSILVHNANTPPQPPPPPPPIPDSHNITYANSIGASSHLVASSMNLANNSDISNNDHQHYKMETSSTLPQDIMYYQNSGTEMNQSTDGFLSSILNDEDLQLMDIPLNEYNGRNGSDYGVNTFRYSSSEDPHRIPIVAQKKHHMFGKRYFHENSHAGTTSSNNLGASGNTMGGGIPIVTPYAPPYATAQGTTPMEGATAIDPSEMKYSCTMDFRPENVVAAFVAKLLLHKKNIGRREFHNFPNLSVSCNNDDLLAYCQHLGNLHSDFIERFQDILKLEIPDWVLDPFSNVNTAISSQLREELIELTTNEEIKIKFKNGYQEFWLQKPIPQLYPELWSIVQRFLIAFPSSYLCERGFSAVATLLTKKRNRLHVTERGYLRLFLSKFEPDINKLVKNHQIHPSH